VLNARFHEQEADIIAQAGAPGGVTIATNMAGRGTDIKLGGNLEMLLKKELAGIDDPAQQATRVAEINDEVAAAHEKVKGAGGLFVIGTERHESRRIDNQLRGRSGRQGDPGRSRFFLSLEDDLMRIFGSDRMGGMLQRLGLKDGEAIVHPWINKALEKAQKKVEARNFDTRKNVLKYDDVMNAQRKEVYAQRKEFMKATDVTETVADMRAEVIETMVMRRVPEKAFSEQWELKELADDLRRVLNLDLPIEEWGREEGIDESHLRERVDQAADALMAAKAANMGPELMRFIEKSLLIQTLDAVWKEHLYALDHLRQGIGLRAYGQRDPLNEYKSEAFALFNAMLDELKERVTGMLARVELAPEPVQPPPPIQMTEMHPQPVPVFAGEPEMAMEGAGAMTIGAAQPMRSDAVDPNDPATWRNTSRNAPCPCGSGKKYKHCHGRLG
jgi:preprotein translocase subunit SecA